MKTGKKQKQKNAQKQNQKNTLALVYNTIISKSDFLVQNFINQVFCGSYTIIKAKFKFCILQTSEKGGSKVWTNWSLGGITGLKKVVLQISVQREHAVQTFSYFKA